MLVPVSSSTRNPKGGILADFVFEMIEEKKGGLKVVYVVAYRVENIIECMTPGLEFVGVAAPYFPWAV